MKRENDLGRDKISSLVLRIALPSMLAQFVSVFYSIVDRIYIGNIPETGDIALAGVGVCGPVVTMVGSAAFLIGIGGSPLMSIRLGERKTREAEKILANSFLSLCVISALLMAAGEKSDECPEDVPCDRRWALFAVLSAVFAALTSILAKVGVEGVESNLATALRTGVVLVMAWAIVLARGKQRQLRGIDRREAAFIALSGVATGASWLCYYYAIQNGPVSVVVPIDKLSILVTVAFSALVLRERLGRRELGGLTLLVAGTLAIAAA